MRRSETTGLILALSLAAPGSSLAAAKTLDFQVYLDQSPIGEHRFELMRVGSEKRVVSQASFDVRLLIFNAYRYRHQSQEQWRDGCLERISAATDNNGEDIRVSGVRVDGQLALEVNGRPSQLPPCVGSFAYWDTEFLRRPYLLNPQSGALVATQLEAEGLDRRAFRGTELEARRYRLRADDLDIVLWYTREGEWIGLEADTGQGRVLRYERR